MITYIEKGIGLHEKIGKNYRLFESNGVWLSDNDEAVQELIDSYTLEECQERIVVEISKKYFDVLEEKTATTPKLEMSYFDLKQKEAYAYMQSNDANDAKFIALEASERGITVEELANKILDKADKMDVLLINLLGNLGKHKDAVRKTTSFIEALSYDWSTGW